MFSLPLIAPGPVGVLKPPHSPLSPAPSPLKTARVARHVSCQSSSPLDARADSCHSCPGLTEANPKGSCRLPPPAAGAKAGPKRPAQDAEEESEHSLHHLLVVSYLTAERGWTEGTCKGTWASAPSAHVAAVQSVLRLSLLLHSLTPKPRVLRDPLRAPWPPRCLLGEGAQTHVSMGDVGRGSLGHQNGLQKPAG